MHSIMSLGNNYDDDDDDVLQSVATLVYKILHTAAPTPACSNVSRENAIHYSTISQGSSDNDDDDVLQSVATLV